MARLVPVSTDATEEPRRKRLVPVESTPPPARPRRLVPVGPAAATAAPGPSVPAPPPAPEPPQPRFDPQAATRQAREGLAAGQFTGEPVTPQFPAAPTPAPTVSAPAQAVTSPQPPAPPTTAPPAPVVQAPAPPATQAAPQAAPASPAAPSQPRVPTPLMPPLGRDRDRFSPAKAPVAEAAPAATAQPAPAQPAAPQAPAPAPAGPWSISGVPGAQPRKLNVGERFLEEQQTDRERQRRQGMDARREAREADLDLSRMVRHTLLGEDADQHLQRLIHKDRKAYFATLDQLRDSEAAMRKGLGLPPRPGTAERKAWDDQQQRWDEQRQQMAQQRAAEAQDRLRQTIEANIHQLRRTRTGENLLQNIIAQRYGAGAGDRADAIIRAVNRGTLDMVGSSIPETLAMALDATGARDSASSLRGWAAVARQAAQDMRLRPEPKHEESVFDKPDLLLDVDWYLNVLGEQAPIIASMLLSGGTAGVAARGLGLGARGVAGAQRLAGLSTAFGFEAGSHLVQMRDELIARGWDPERAQQAAEMESVVYGILASGLEYLPLDKFLRGNRVGRASLTGIIRRGLAQAPQEGITETLQEMTGDIAALLGVRGDPIAVENIKRWLEAGLQGAVVGGGTGVVGSVAQGGGAAPVSAPQPAAQPGRIQVETRDGVQEVDVEPTDPQKEAGNYKKAHVRIDGLEVSIENPAGTMRRGVDRDGNPWEVEVAADYGYIRRTEGKDGDQVDVFIKPDTTPEAMPVFIVNQVDPETGAFDEHKVMLGYATEEDARAAYLSNYQEGWQGLGSVAQMTFDQFKEWVRDGKKRGPVKSDEETIPDRIPGDPVGFQERRARGDFEGMSHEEAVAAHEVEGRKAREAQDRIGRDAPVGTRVWSPDRSQYWQKEADDFWMPYFADGTPAGSHSKRPGGAAIIRGWTVQGPAVTPAEAAQPPAEQEAVPAQTPRPQTPAKASAPQPALPARPSAPDPSDASATAPSSPSPEVERPSPDSTSLPVSRTVIEAARQHDPDASVGRLVQDILAAEENFRRPLPSELKDFGGGILTRLDATDRNGARVSLIDALIQEEIDPNAIWDVTQNHLAATAMATAYLRDAGYTISDQSSATQAESQPATTGAGEQQASAPETSQAQQEQAGRRPPSEPQAAPGESTGARPTGASSGQRADGDRRPSPDGTTEGTDPIIEAAEQVEREAATGTDQWRPGQRFRGRAFRGTMEAEESPQPTVYDAEFVDLKGIYLTQDADDARTYADMNVDKGAGDAGVVTEYEVDLRNPANEAIEEAVARDLGIEVREFNPGIDDEGGIQYDRESASAVADELVRRGYDGVIRRNGDVVVLDPKALKKVDRSAEAAQRARLREQGEAEAAAARDEARSKADPERAQQGDPFTGEPIDVIRGDEATLRLADGRKVRIQYVAHEARAVKPSNDPTRNYAAVPGADFNERFEDYRTPGSSSRQTIEEGVKEPKPDLLFSNDPTPTNGPAIIEPRGAVLGGNGRTMMKWLIYHQGGEKAQQLREAAIRAAEKFGMDPDVVAKLEQPDVSRMVLDDPGVKGELSRVLNEALTAGRSAAVDAASRGRQVTDATAAVVSGLLESADEAMSLRELLGDPDLAARLTQRLVKDGALSSSEAQRYTDKTGAPTAAGKLMIEEILLGRIIDDARVLAQLPGSVRSKLLAALSPILRGGPLLLEKLRVAADAFPAYKASGSTIGDYFFRQASMIPVPGFKDLAVASLVHGLERLGPRRFRVAVEEYRDRAGISSGEGRLGFAVAEQSDTPAMAFYDAFGIGLSGIPTDVVDRAGQVRPLSKAQRKKLWASMEPVTELKEDHGRSFDLSVDHITVPLDKLIPTKPPESQPGSVENAKKGMSLAQQGRDAKREPISVIDLGDGTYQVADGNATYGAARDFGWKALPVSVKGKIRNDRRILAWRAYVEATGQGTDNKAARDALIAAMVEEIDETGDAEATSLIPAAEEVIEFRAIYKKAVEVQAAFEARVNELQQQHGRDPDAPRLPKALAEYGEGALIGPIKKPDRVLAKAREDVTSVTAVKDVLRATVVVDTVEDMENLAATLEAQLPDLVPGRFKDRWSDDSPMIAPTLGTWEDVGYRDILTNLSIDGFVVEVQFNVPEMLYAKQHGGHQFYESYRKIDAKRDRAKNAGDEAAVQDYIRQLEPIAEKSRAHYADALREARARRASTSARKRASSTMMTSRSRARRATPSEGEEGTPATKDTRWPSGSRATGTSPSPTSRSSEPGGREEIASDSGMASGSTDIIAQTPVESKEKPVADDTISGDGREPGDAAPAGRPADQGGEAVAAPKPARPDAAEGVSGGEQSGSQSRQPGGERASAAGRGRDAGSRTSVATPDAGRAEGAAGPGAEASGRSEGVRGRDASTRPAVGDPARNHEIKPDDVVAPRGNAGKFNANIAAIRLLRRLEREKRLPTAVEKQTLAQYTGWGWAGEYFNETNPRYDKQRTILRELLTDEEWRSAAGSTLNAHYTSPEVIRAMWEMAARLGFEGGRVLEPSGGVGHFFGMMPREVADRSTLIGVELDSVSGRIFKALYPEADIRIQGFEATRIANNSIDLAISNVPFGNYKLKATDYPQLFIHDYFFARALDKVRPGGLVMFITSDGTLNKGDQRVRRMLAERADLVAAVRLPNNAFQENAGTEVTTDIVILRKKDGTPFRGEPFQNLQTVGNQVVQDRGEQPIRINEYFAAHPEMALGRHTLSGTMHARGDYALVADPGQDTGALLRDVVGRLPRDVFGARPADVQDQQIGEAAGEGDKDLSYVLRDGKVYQVVDGQLTAPEWLTSKNFGANPDASITEKQKAERITIARDWIALKGVVQELFAAENSEQVSDEELAKMRRRLNREYDKYVQKWGTLTRTLRHYEKAAFLEDDPDYPLMQAIEDEVVTVNRQTGKETRTWKKGLIFAKRLRTPRSMPNRVDTVEDAISVSMGYRNGIDLDLVARLMGLDRDEAKRRVLRSGEVFENPESGLLEPRARYLSGNVRQKLRAAEQAATDNPDYSPNVEALREVQPPDISIADIHFDLGSRWIPEDVLMKFAESELGTAANIRYVATINSYSVQFHNRRTPALETTYGTAKMHGADIFRHALEGTQPRITEKVKLPDGKETIVTDVEGTRAAEVAIDRLKRAFVSWVKTSGAEVDVDGRATLVQDRLAQSYNERNNSIVAPEYDGSHLALPGLTDIVHRTPHRMAVVARILQEGAAVMAHGVGSGKTFSQIIAAMEMKRLGLARKPMIVVQKATIGQFAASFRQAYPDARILVADEKSFTARFRKKFMSRLAMGDFDAVVVTQPQFDRLPNHPDSVTQYYQEQIDALEDAIRAEKATEGGRSPTTKELEKAKKRLEAKLANAVEAMKERQDDTVFFEELGVDALLIDEAHAYKRVPIVTKKLRVKGIPSDNSDRAIGLHIKSRHIQAKNQGKGVILATGTPVTNSMAEAYVMLMLATPRLLEEYQIHNFDDFANTFGVTQTKLEFNWGGKWTLATRFNKFVNGPELVTLVRSGFDVKMGNKELGLKVPDIKGGAPELVIVPQSPTAAALNGWILDIAEQFEKSKDKRAVSWVPITTMSAGMSAALDPRLIDPTLPDEPDSKVNVAVKRITEIYQATAATRGTQLVFADRFKPMDVTRLRDFAGGVGEVELDLDSIDLDDTGDVEAEGDKPSKNRQSQEEADYRSGGFNLYHDIRGKLVKAGVPAHEIAIIHDYNTDKKRAKLFDQVKAGKVRVLIGSTEKMGVGVNVQDRLVAAHHLDPPRMMTPAMLEQRDGRIIRQGNQNKEVQIIRYGVEKSMDIGIYQMLEDKQRFIVQVLSGRGVGRTFDDAADEIVMGMAEMKAKLTGDPRTLRLMEVDQTLRDLYTQRSAFENEKASARSRLGQMRQQIATLERELPQQEAQLEEVKAAFDGKTWDAQVGRHALSKRSEVVNAIDAVFEKMRKDQADTVTITVNGWAVRLNRLRFGDEDSRTIQLIDDRGRNLYGAAVKNGNGAVMVLSQLPRSLATELQRTQAELKAARDGIPALEKAVSESWDKARELAALEREREQLETALLTGSTVEAQLAAENARASRQQDVPDAAGRRADFGRPTTHHAKMPKQQGHVKVRPKQEASKPRTESGKQLVEAIERDTKGQRVGMRSIVRFVSDLAKAELRIGLEQTTQRNPAHYIADDYHIIRSKTESWQLNFHEAGHALAALIRDAAPEFLQSIGGRLISLASRPGSMASAKTIEEGFAEWVRLYIVDPGAIPREITKRLESQIRKSHPQILDGLHDAQVAFAAHSARDVDATFASYMRDRAKDRPFRDKVTDFWHTFAYAMSAGTVLGTRVHRRVFGAIRKFSLDLAREWETQISDTPADFRSAYQMTLHVPQEVARAMYGARKGDEGIRVVMTGGNPFRDVVATLPEGERMKFISRFDLGKVTGGARHGNYLYLTDYSIHNIIEAVGKKDWDAFELYIWRRAALSRYRKKGHRYPGLTEDQSPGVMQERIEAIERKHPQWKSEGDRLRKWLNQLLLVSVLNGEITPEQAMEMVDTYDFYIPLNRAVQRTPQRRSGRGAEPTAGLWYAFGSDIPFEHVLDAIENATRMSFEAYYHSRVMWAVHEAGQQLSNMKSVPLEARAIGRRLMVPLELDWKKVATLDVTEQQKVIADYLNEQIARQKGVSLDKVPYNELVQPDDVVISFPGQDIWRQVKPKAIRVIAPWRNGERRYFQIEDPLLYEFFARTKKPIHAIVALSNMMTKVVRPWKRGITHTWPFALWNVLTRDPSTAMLLGRDATSWMPYGYILRAVLNRVTGKVPAAISQSELLSKALDATNTKAHQTLVDKFLAVLGEGIAVEGWSRMSWGQRLAELPGQAMSVLIKPVDMLNYVSGSRAFAEFSEALSREGAFIAAKERGLSDEAAQAQYDFITGNFGERSGSPTLAAMFRAAGFLNPGIQILTQTYGKLTAPDPRRRGELGLKLVWLGMLGAVSAVINYLLLDDEDKEQLRERTDEDRTRYMHVKVPMVKGVRIRLPFDYGPSGAAASFGWNLMEGWLLSESVNGKALAWAMMERFASLPALVDVMGPHLKTMVELETNHSFFFGEPIVPPWMQSAYPNNPELQAYDGTIELYRWIGEAIGASPIKVQYAVRNIFTSQFSDTVEAINRVAAGRPLATELGDTPYIGRLFAREQRGWRAKSMRELGDLDRSFQALRTAQRRLVEAGQGDDPRVEEIERKLAALDAHHAAMKEISRIWQAVKDERRSGHPDHTVIARLEREMALLARRHLKASAEQATD